MLRILGIILSIAFVLLVVYFFLNYVLVINTGAPSQRKSFDIAPVPPAVTP